MTEETEVESEDNKTEDIDSLLDEFDSDTKEEPKEVEDTPDPRLDMVESLVARQEQQDLEATVTQVKGLDENLKDIPDRIVKNLLRAEAADDPRIQKAYNARFQNPEKWQTVQKTLAKTLGEQLQRPDSRVTSDTEAARAAVKGSSTTQPDESLKIDVENLGSMSDREFKELEKRALRG